MKTLIISLKIFLFFTILAGIVYPLVITGITQLVFSEKANGSLIFSGNKVIGSELIGQLSDSIIYFTSRPSAISCNPLHSGGSNYCLTNLKLKQQVQARREQFIRLNQTDSLTIVHSEMLFASASGLDPHISIKAASLQVERIVKTRHLDDFQKQQLIQTVSKLTEMPQFGLLGEKRINVLLLNIKLDQLSSTKN